MHQDHTTPAGRRHRLVIALTTLALLLAACGGSGAAAGDDGGPVELTMYYPVAVGGPLTDVVDGLISDFEAEHPDIQVEAVYSGSYADTMTKAQTAARSDEGPDLAVLLTTELFSLIDQDLIVPFDELTEDLSWLDRFYEPFVVSGQDGEGTTWSIPFQRSTIVQYHNKDLFTEAGLDPESPPATWEELVETSETIVESGAAPYGIEIPSTQFTYWMFQALAVQNDTLLMDGSGSGAQTSFDEPGAVEALEFWLSLSEQGLMPTGAIEWASTPEDFLQEQTAMMWTTTGNLTNVRDNASFDFGVSMLPEGVRQGSPTGGGNFYVFQDTTEAERQAAVTLVEWLTQPERTAEWSMETGYVATGPEAWETETMSGYVEEFPQAAVARDQLEFAIPELTTHDNGRVTQILNDALQSALTGQQSPQEALAGAQQQADEILQRYRD